MFTIQCESLTEDLRKKVFEGFSRHAIKTTGHDGFRPVEHAFIAYDDGTFAGTVVVEFFWGALGVKYVYVDDKYRNHGLGSRLMKSALDFGREHNCPFAFVSTMSFQALGFYQKMGFQLEFTRTGYAYDTSLHFLRKDLINQTKHT